MAGIGVKLNNIYGKNTLTTDVIGMGYSTVMTIAPMLTVIGALCIMEYFLDFSSVGYVTRELFSCTVLYIFIFALLTASPFNSVLSKYMSDVIYEETYADIMACYYVGLFLNILLSSLVGIRFVFMNILSEKWISFMFLPDIVDLSHWYLYFIRCFICPSVRITRRFRSSLSLEWPSRCYCPSGLCVGYIKASPTVCFWH